MAIATLIIGLIPSYASIGIAVPILLLCARLVQGFSTGGEYSGAMTFILFGKKTPSDLYYGRSPTIQVEMNGRQPIG